MTAASFLQPGGRVFCNSIIAALVIRARIFPSDIWSRHAAARGPNDHLTRQATQVHKLDTFTDDQRAAQAATRAAIWQLYADLKAYRGAPSARLP